MLRANHFPAANDIMPAAGSDIDMQQGRSDQIRSGQAVVSIALTRRVSPAAVYVLVHC